MAINVPNQIVDALEREGVRQEVIATCHNFFKCFNDNAIKLIVEIVIPVFGEFFNAIKTDSLEDYDDKHFVHFLKYFLDNTSLKSLLKEANILDIRTIRICDNLCDYYTKNHTIILKEYQAYLRYKQIMQVC